jgi:hypothetical protein
MCRVHPVDDIVQRVVIFCKRKVVTVGVRHPGYIVLYFVVFTVLPISGNYRRLNYIPEEMNSAIARKMASGA